MKTIEQEFPTEKAFAFVPELANAYTRLRARAVEMERVQQWRPIDEAPDKGEVLVCCDRTPRGDYYLSDVYHAWRDDSKPSGWARWPHGFPPTHFRPLPPSPEPHQTKPCQTTD